MSKNKNILLEKFSYRHIGANDQDQYYMQNLFLDQTVLRVLFANQHNQAHKYPSDPLLLFGFFVLLILLLRLSCWIEILIVEYKT